MNLEGEVAIEGRARQNTLQGGDHHPFSGFMTRKVLVITLMGAVLLFVVMFLTRPKPENADEFTPVKTGAICFQSISEDGSFKPSTGVPLVESALGKSFYEQNVDGVYNKITMRCRLQIVSGPPEQSSLDEFRVLLATSKVKVLLSLHLLNGIIVSDEFVCVRDEGILSIPGIKEVAMEEKDHLKATLVSRHH